MKPFFQSSRSAAAVAGLLCCHMLCTLVAAQAPVVKSSPKPVAVADFQIRVGDEVAPAVSADWSSLGAFEKIQHPLKRSAALQANGDEQRLQLSFSLADAAAKTAVQPQQVFVRLASAAAGGGEAIFVPDVDPKTSSFKLDVDLKTQGSKQFNSLPGKYELSLIVGDARLQSFRWVIADVELTFQQPGTPAEDYYAPRPAIEHMFRQPEKRPAVFVSNVFCVAIAALFGLMVLLWTRLGCVSLSGVTASSLLFQASLGVILYIEYLFYLGDQDMFVTLRYLSWAAPVALFFGRRMLANLAKKEEELHSQ